MASLLEAGGAGIAGITGTLAAWGEGIAEQVRTIVQKTYDEGEGVSGPDSFDFTGFGDLGIHRTEFQQGIYRLAVLNAQALGLGTGRALSDRDVQMQITSLSGGKGDPEATKNLLVKSTKGILLDLQSDFQVAGDKGYNIFGELSEYGDDLSLFQDKPIADAGREEGLWR
tara:strand:- start:2344 stop:2853 length:510 start_codon:yes stop_codon:yes gene_type:complete